MIGKLFKSKITIKIIIEEPKKPKPEIKPKKERNLKMITEPNGRTAFNKGLIAPKKY